MAETRQPPFFPSELQKAHTFQLSLAGRVLGVESGGIWVADAFATVRVRGSLEVEVGDLVVLSVNTSSGEPTAVAIEELHRPSGRSRDEQTRFIDGRVAANLRVRGDALATVRAFFATRHFLEVDTPLEVPSPGLDLHLDAVETTGGYLITSPEYQMKRLLAAGVPRLFQVAHVFRRGEVGARHNPEFTMLEWYRAFAGVEDVMRDTEELVADVFRSLAGVARAHAPRFDAPFDRMSVGEAFRRFASVSEADFFDLAASDASTFFRVLVDKVEPALASWPRPIFLVDYPISQASLARANPAEPRVCERFELYVGGVELCNGFGELTDPVEQRQRLVADQNMRAALGKPVYPIDERFIAALEEGIPPSAGNALGFDRLVALALGEPEIARVIAFPAGIV